MNMHAFHDVTPLQDAETLARFERAGLQTAGAHVSGAPSQQFSVK
jgi:hypothetical protein